MGKFLIYGAYGYTGKIIVERAVERGLTPILGGRNLHKIKAIADQYNLAYIHLKASDVDGWSKALEQVDLVLNCAGPFALTVEYIVPFCLRSNTHYLDITGEIDVFSYIASLDREAKTSSVVLLPGVGFDIVPTDCLGAQLHEQLPDATHLELAFQGNSGISRGTALSMARRYHEGGTIRENGKLTPVPIAYEVKPIYFGGMDRTCMTIPWGDVYTAYHTTGIKNIKVYTGVNQKTLKSLLSYKKLTWIAKTAVAQWLMRKIIRKKVDGPSAEARANNQTYLWGKVWNEAGKSVSMEMTTPESYHLTALTAIASVEKVLSGEVAPGYQTPVKAFGNKFIEEFDRVNISKIDD
jgi:short subunit dehydrogenase-like uncharacterized protein